VELRDLVVTPIILTLIYVVAILIRPMVTDEQTRRYFLLGLTARIFGALAVGFIYQFYYGGEGGDTFAYHTYGSRYIYNAFLDSPWKGFDLLFSNGVYKPETYDYSKEIWYFRDPQSFFIIRIATVLDFLTFSSYSATAILFACISFAGAWMLYSVFYKLYPHLHTALAVAVLFIPTVFFWGGGIFKDTLTLAALGAATYLLAQIFIYKKYSVLTFLSLLFCCWVVYSIKKYILLSFMPAAITWIFIRGLANIKSAALKIIVAPLVIIATITAGYFAVIKVAEDDPRYALDKLATTAKITAYDIRYWTGKDAGSGYSLGELDGTFSSMVKLAPQAINVSLFRPYLWEVRNPLMLISAFESLVFLLLTLYVIFTARGSILKSLNNPDIIFCLIFSLVFAFAVGVSTYNFGTLSRYKIPLMPFYSIALVLIYAQLNKLKKQSVLDVTE
jgi:hypothetical protein